MRIPSCNSEKNIEEKSDVESSLCFRQYSVETEIRIDVFKGVRTFGLVLVGGSSDQQTPGDSSIYVSKVLEGGLAGVDGRILPGDRIAAVKQFLEDGDAYTFSFDENGSATHEDAKQILRRCKGKVALFIVRKDEILSTHNDNESAITETVSFENKLKVEENTSCCQSSNSNNSETNNNQIHNDNEQNFNKSTLSMFDASECAKTDSLDTSHSLTSSVTSETYNKEKMPRVQLIDLTPLRHFRGSHKPMSQPSNGCAMDYRDMAKYGIRPGSSVSGDVLELKCDKIKNHRIKKTWLSNKMSAISIQEDDEEEIYSSSLSHINHRFEIDMEQRVL